MRSPAAAACVIDRWEAHFWKIPSAKKEANADDVRMSLIDRSAGVVVTTEHHPVQFKLLQRSLDQQLSRDRAQAARELRKFKLSLAKLRQEQDNNINKPPKDSSSLRSSLTESRLARSRLLDTLQRREKDLTGELLEATTATHVEVTDVDQHDHHEQEPPWMIQDDRPADDEEEERMRKNGPPRRKREISTSKTSSLSGWSQTDRRIFLREVFKTGEEASEKDHHNILDEQGADEVVVRRIWSLTSGEITDQGIVRKALAGWKQEREERRRTKKKIQEWRSDQIEKKIQLQLQLQMNGEEKSARDKLVKAKDSACFVEILKRKKKKKIGQWRELKRMEGELEKTDQVLEQVAQRLKQQQDQVENSKKGINQVRVKESLKFNKPLIEEVPDLPDNLRRTLLKMFTDNNQQLAKIKASSVQEAADNHSGRRIAKISADLERNPERILSSTKSFAAKFVVSDDKCDDGKCLTPKRNCNIESTPRLGIPDWRRSLCSLD